ncbi:MAG: hypothetical protein R3300_13580 [Candidatus Promineifilaceae bacterium]|nr:hypothetical protein [Candidatus Promineifilaceae bacterium]
MKATSRQLLEAIAAGQFLKSHRDIDGNKSFILHDGNGGQQQINPAVVELLRRQGLIDSNKKFPVATFWLTDAGHQLLEDN